MLATLAVLGGGCAGDATRYDRPLISKGIEARTGHSIAPAAEPGDSTLPDGVVTADGISREETVAIALWNNAAFQEAISELGFHRAELIQAGLLENPLFSILFPVGPKQLEFTATFPLEALFLRPRRLEVAELDCERAGALLVEHGLDLVYEVRAAFSELELARKRLAHARASSALTEEILALQEARLRAGDASEMEVAAARVTAIEQRVDVTRLAREKALAESRLQGLLGPGLDREPLRFVSMDSPQVEEVPDLPRLLRRAEAARPDIRAAELGMELAGERAGLAHWEILKIAALADANGDGDDGFEIGPGMVVEVPLFDQGQGRNARARAELEKAAHHYVTVRHAVAVGVRAAYFRLLQAVEGLDSWRVSVLPALEDAVRQARQAHDAGATSHLAVLQSRERLTRGRLTEAVLTRDVRVARAELERQVGWNLPLKTPEGALSSERTPPAPTLDGTQADSMKTEVQGHVEGD
jgi:cobalt-zinc-cadmium efflux system outer membrane protein